MGLDGRQGDGQLSGDLHVGLPAGDEGQHLALALSESVKHRRRRRGDLGAAHEVGNEPPGDGRIEEGFPLGDDVDRGQEFRGRGVLEQEAACPRPERGVHQLIVIEHGQSEHPCLGAGANLAGGLDAIRLGHAYVHKRDVGLSFARQPDGLSAVGCLADDHHPWGGLHQQPKTPAQQGLVIRDDHPNGPGRDAWHSNRVGEGAGGHIRRGYVILGNEQWRRSVIGDLAAGDCPVAVVGAPDHQDLVVAQPLDGLRGAGRRVQVPRRAAGLAVMN